MLQAPEITPRKQIVSLILYKNGKVLVGVRKVDRVLDSGKCLFPGGHVHEGEDLETAVKREMYEELGIILLNPKLVYTADFETQGESQTLNWFGCTEFDNDPVPNEDSELIWIDPKTESHYLSYEVSRTALNKFLLDTGK